MYSTLNEALIAPSYLIISAISIWAVIVCSKRKELAVEPTQPSLRENSKISVFNRDGETDIEMPSHSHKVKELEKNRKSDERESSKMKKLDGKSDPNSNESEKRHPHSGKEKHSRKEVLSAKNDSQDRQMKDKQNFNKNEEVVTDDGEKKEKGTERSLSNRDPNREYVSVVCVSNEALFICQLGTWKLHISIKTNYHVTYKFCTMIFDH